jgi:hypothetical protein
MYAGVDPVQLVDEAIVLADHLARGVTAVAEWTELMVKEFGEGIRQHLDAIHVQAQQRLTDAKKEMARESVRKAKPESEAGMGRAVRLLSEMLMAEGITEREALVDAVHEELKAVIPEITRREVMDLISGYGQFSPLTTDEQKLRLGEIRGELQQIAKLQDMEKGLAPLKTGKERQKLSDEGRALQKRVNEERKRLGIVATDPKRQLAGFLDGMKTRFRNQIADMERQIEARELDVKTKTKVKDDAELKELRRRRDETLKVFNEVFNPPKQEPGKREVQRARALERFLEKDLADLKRRVGEGDTSPRKKGKKGLITPKIKRLRAERDAVTAELKVLREAQKPKPDPIEVATQQHIARRLRRIAEMQAQMKLGELPQKRKPREIREADPKVVQLTAEFEAVESEYLEWKHDLELESRTFWQKVAGIPRDAGEFVKSIKSSFDDSAIFNQGLLFLTSGHLTESTWNSLRAISEKSAMEIDAWIRTHPLYEIARRHGLFFTSPLGKPGPQEEAIHSRWAEKIPGLKVGIKGSNRVFITYLNVLRLRVFESTIKWAGGVENLTDEDLASVANFTNIGSGRGNAGAFKSALDGLGWLAWAAHLHVSRAQVLFGPAHGFAFNPKKRTVGYSTKVSLKTRKAIATHYARAGIFWASVYTLLSGLLDDDDIGTDWTKSNFLAVRLGGRWWRPLSGYHPFLVLIGRTYEGSRTSWSGKKTRIRRTDEEDIPYTSPGWWETLTDFARTKLAPGVGLLVNIGQGEDIMGRRATVGTEAVSAITPSIALEEIFEALTEEGLKPESALLVMALLGIGSHPDVLDNHKPRRR